MFWVVGWIVRSWCPVTTEGEDVWYVKVTHTQLHYVSVVSVDVNYYWIGQRRLFYRQTAAVKRLSPKVLCVRETAHVLSAANQWRRRPLSATVLLSSGKYMPVPDQTATGEPDMQFCSRLVAGQEAGATGAAHAWCDYMPVMSCAAALPHEAVRYSKKQMSCSSLDGEKRRLELMFWQVRLLVTNSWTQLSKLGISRSTKPSDVCTLQIVTTGCRRWLLSPVHTTRVHGPCSRSTSLTPVNTEQSSEPVFTVHGCQRRLPWTRVVCTGLKVASRLDDFNLRR